MFCRHVKCSVDVYKCECCGIKTRESMLACKVYVVGMCGVADFTLGFQRVVESPHRSERSSKDNAP